MSLNDNKDPKSIIIELISKAVADSPKKDVRTRRQNPSIIINQTIHYDINGQVSFSDITNFKQISKSQFFIIRDERFISNDIAKRIKDKIDKLVELDVATGVTVSVAYAKRWQLLLNYFGVQTYLEIPSEKGEEALSFLRKCQVLMRPKIRRQDHNAWRKEHYTAIYARQKQAGKSKSDLNILVKQLLGKDVISLKNLGERDLKSLYEYIMRNW